MNDENTHKKFGFDETIAFIQEAHQGQKYGNMPYYYHPVEVARETTRLTQNTDAILAALLHDVIEDTKYTADDLRKHYSDHVVDTVVLLTSDKGVPYLDNIQKIINSGNRDAMMVKLADNRVNRRGDKSGFKPEKAQKLNDRYDASMEMLSKALGIDE